MDQENILTLAADIVSAHVSNNRVDADQLPGLIQSVYGALAGLGEPEAPAEVERTPAVSIRASVKPDAITCLECGRRMKTIKRHLSSDHGLTPAEYKARWNLPANYPMVAPAYAERRKELAVTIGLGRKRTAAPKAKSGTTPENAAAPETAKKPGRPRKKLSPAYEGGEA
jgi:predicted transcriptional regulator